MATLDLQFIEVRRQWAAQGILGSDVSLAEIESVEGVLGRLPAEYREFAQVVGAQNDSDKNGFLFWPIRRIEPVTAVLGRGGYSFVCRETLIVIADYMQESWWYGLWTTGPSMGSVSLILGGSPADPQPPITFERFIQSYLADDRSLYPETSREK